MKETDGRSAFISLHLAPPGGTTRWTTTLSSKVNLPQAIDLREFPYWQVHTEAEHLLGALAISREECPYNREKHTNIYPGYLGFGTLASLSLRLKDPLEPVTRVKKKKKRFIGYQHALQGVGVTGEPRS